MKEVYADLDALITERVRFKFKSKEYTIDPISAVNFMRFSNALMEVKDFMERKTVTPDECIGKYVSLIESVCPQMTKDIVVEMTQSQLVALLNLIIETVGARVQGEAGKKKVMPILVMNSLDQAQH